MKRCGCGSTVSSALAPTAGSVASRLPLARARTALLARSPGGPWSVACCPARRFVYARRLCRGSDWRVVDSDFDVFACAVACAVPGADDEEIAAVGKPGRVPVGALKES